MTTMSGRLYGFRAAGNPLLQIATALVLGIALLAAVLMGALLLVLLVGAAVIAATVLSVRLWWQRRKQGGAPRAERRGSGQLIEAEYSVVVERDVARQRESD